MNSIHAKIVILFILILAVITGLYFLFIKKVKDDKVKDDMINLKMSLSEKIIEGFDGTPTPDPSKSYINKFMVFLKICENILGKDMPVLCYKIDNIKNVNPSVPSDPSLLKINRMMNEILRVAIEKSIKSDNIYDTGALFISYTSFTFKDFIPIEYDKDGIPTKIKISRNTLPELLTMISSRDETIKNIIDKFPDLKNNSTNILTLKEVGQVSYVLGVILSKLPKFTVDPTRYPACDNI